MGPDFTATHVRQMLRAYMGANDLTQTSLAKKIGISTPYLNDILLEKREPQGHRLCELEVLELVAGSA